MLKLKLVFTRSPLFGQHFDRDLWGIQKIKKNGLNGHILGRKGKHTLCDLQKNYNDYASHIYAHTTYKLKCYVRWHGCILLCICFLIFGVTVLKQWYIDT